MESYVGEPICIHNLTECVMEYAAQLDYCPTLDIKEIIDEVSILIKILPEIKNVDTFLDLTFPERNSSIKYEIFSWKGMRYHSYRVILILLKQR